ncbi:MAG: right-handed parallel beta-helix repeat-containing protein [Halanaeroarchaeum sp.]
MTRTRTLAALLVVGIVVSGLPAPTAAAGQGAEEIAFVESDVAGDTTWTSEEGPYRVIQDVRIDRGATLTIEAGTTVQFAAGVTLSVAGSLVTNGTTTAPVRFRVTPGAPSSVRWDTIRYVGTETSRLILNGSHLAGATDGITVESARGRIALRQTTVRDVSGAGIDVATAHGLPRIDVIDATFAAVGGHAIAATPGAGTVAAVDLRARATGIGERTRHTLSLVPGAGADFDTVALGYGARTGVPNLTAADLERFGIDADGDARVERSLLDRVDRVRSTDGRIVVSLKDAASLDGDERLVLAVEGLRNPRTRGVYPVDVTLRNNGVRQLADGVHAPLVIGDVATEIADTTVASDTAVGGLSVVGTVFRDVGGHGLFVAADRADVEIRGSRFANVDGDAIGVRGRTVSGVVRSSQIAADDAGIAVRTRHGIDLAILGTAIRGAATGVSIRQSGSRYRVPLSVRVADVEVRDGEAGIVIAAEQGRLVRSEFSGTLVAGMDGDGIRVDAVDVTRTTFARDRLLRNGDDGLVLRGGHVTRTTIRGGTVAQNGDDGIAVLAGLSARRVTIANATVRDNGGSGVRIETGLVAHRVSVTRSLIANNARVGVAIRSALTHAGRVRIANATIAANAYGVHVVGAMNATLTGNDVVYNTNAFADTVPVAGVPPGAGVVVEEGPAGVVLSRAETAIDLATLVANPRIDAQLATAPRRPDTAVVLRTDGNGHARLDAAAALPATQVLEDLPTGVALPTEGNATGVTVARNDVYGQPRGLVVDVDPLVEANTTARLMAGTTRTVTAEHTYWGAESGPYHSSILPSGDGTRVRTRDGWVDFVPFAGTPHGPRYDRPTPGLQAPATAESGTVVTVTGRPRENVSRYHFRASTGRRAVTTEPTWTVRMPNRSLTVTVAVEDDLGIDSARRASATVALETDSRTVTQPTASTTATATGPATPPGPTERGPWPTVFGLLGAGLYLAAVLTGAHGMWLTLRRRDPPVAGRTVHALAGGAVLVWAIGGLLVGSGLLVTGVAGAVLWAAATGLAAALAGR